MTLDALLYTVPPYANDLKLNLSNLLRQTELTAQQTWGTAVASAMASRNRILYKTLCDEASERIPPQAVDAAKTAAAL
ncbi:MAG: alkyl hydroperoxide reductase, partial [Bryobacteraceae bacterium]